MSSIASPPSEFIPTSVDNEIVQRLISNDAPNSPSGTHQAEIPSKTPIGAMSPGPGQARKSLSYLGIFFRTPPHAFEPTNPTVPSSFRSTETGATAAQAHSTLVLKNLILAKANLVRIVNDLQGTKAMTLVPDLLPSLTIMLSDSKAAAAKLGSCSSSTAESFRQISNIDDTEVALICTSIDAMLYPLRTSLINTLDSEIARFESLSQESSDFIVKASSLYCYVFFCGIGPSDVLAFTMRAEAIRNLTQVEAELVIIGELFGLKRT
ncbi:MAG: hypothetical protein Q9190_000361 [Brigantiaea leucoxantha]